MNGETAKKEQKKRLPDLLLLFFFFAPMLLGAAILLTGQKSQSTLENRALRQLPAVSGEALLQGAFQDDLEDALVDQLPLGESVKGAALDGKNGLLKMQQALLYAAQPALRSNYVPVAEGYYHYAGDAHRIVEKPYDLSTEERQRHLEAMASQFSGLSGAKTYVYFIENSRTVDFDHRDDEHAVYRQVTQAVAPDGADVFAVPDYAFYCENFYQTDHHWNEKGSYAGYQAIYRLLHGTDEGMIGPGEIRTTDAVFQGSYARQAHELCADEAFSFRVFDLPKYSTEINGKRRTYGNLSLYEKGKYAADSLTNHYANCYGGDFGQVFYDFKTEGKGKLLLVASSYSNPVNALIAAGYDQTWVIDLRYYEEWAGKPFDAAAFCAEHEIDTVLLLGDASFFFIDGPGKEGGE